MSKPILVLHGPNLNRLGQREPGVYGTLTLEQINTRIRLRAGELGVEVDCEQSNSEGVLIDRLHAVADGAAGVILNPGALAHTSIALRDAIASIPTPVIEVHLSNVFAREPFRHRLVTAGACRGVISGFGVSSYLLALDHLVTLIPPS